MKTLLTLLTFITLTAQAQDWKQNTPGREMRKASNQFVTGLSLTMAGGALLYIGRNHIDRTIPQAGSLIMAIGSIVNLTSWIHINRAGRLMDKKVTAHLTGNGIKLKIQI